MSLTAKVKLLCQETDNQGYTTYVFEVLEDSEINRFHSKYIMVVRWPNWEHRMLLNGEIGFLNFEEIIAGETQWFDGKDFVPYKYSAIQFNKFVSEQQINMKHEFKL